MRHYSAMFLGLLFSFSIHAQEILLVGHGGYTSCDTRASSAVFPPTQMGMYPRFSDLEAALKSKGHTVHTLAACFGDTQPPKGEAKYISSEAPGKLQYGDATALKTAIESFHKTYGGLTVYLIGHSYGGWTAMYLAQELSNQVKIGGLFSIDPISPKCNSGSFFGNPDCLRAPRDLNNSKIKSQTLIWENFYQRQDNWLQSSSIKEAQNHQMKFRGPHGSIDSDPRVWQIIQSQIVK